MSLDLIELLRLAPESRVIDIGGGASVLVDRLLAKRFTDLTVLDISEAVLQATRGRVGNNARVAWIAADLLSWEPTRSYDLWRLFSIRCGAVFSGDPPIGIHH
jgi:trans-aconitate methyltransferase